MNQLDRKYNTFSKSRFGEISFPFEQFLEKADIIEGVWRSGCIKKHISNMKYLRSFKCVLGVNTVFK